MTAIEFSRERNVPMFGLFLQRELIRSGFKTSDQVQEQGMPRIENGVRHTFWRMSISIRGKTQALDLRWGFETTSKPKTRMRRASLQAQTANF
jgi:hypothetical protein